MRRFVDGPEHPVLTVVAFVGCELSLYAALWLFQRSLGSPEGMVISGLLSLGFGAILAGILFWHRPLLFTLAFTIVWAEFAVEWTILGPRGVTGWLIFWFVYAPSVLGVPLWIASWSDLYRGWKHRRSHTSYRGA